MPLTTIRKACSTPCAAVSTIARGRVTALDVDRRQGASRRRRGDHASQPAAAGARSGREDARPSGSGWRCCRTIACATSTSRSRSSSPRHWRRRPKAPRCSSRDTRPSRRAPGCDSGERFVPRGVGDRHAATTSARRRRGRARRRRERASMRTTRRRRNITTRWSPTRSLRPGTATG